LPSARTSQSRSGELASPGNRSPRPMTAISSMIDLNLVARRTVYPPASGPDVRMLLYEGLLVVLRYGMCTWVGLMMVNAVTPQLLERKRSSESSGYGFLPPVSERVGGYLFEAGSSRPHSLVELRAGPDHGAGCLCKRGARLKEMDPGVAARLRTKVNPGPRMPLHKGKGKEFRDINELCPEPGTCSELERGEGELRTQES